MQNTKNGMIKLQCQITLVDKRLSIRATKIYVALTNYIPERYIGSFLKEI